MTHDIENLVKSFDLAPHQGVFITQLERRTMSTDDRDAEKKATAQESTLPVGDLTPKNVDAAKADAIKGGRATADDSEPNSEKIHR